MTSHLRNFKQPFVQRKTYNISGPAGTRGVPRDTQGPLRSIRHLSVPQLLHRRVGSGRPERRGRPPRAARRSPEPSRQVPDVLPEEEDRGGGRAARARRGRPHAVPGVRHAVRLPQAGVDRGALRAQEVGLPWPPLRSRESVRSFRRRRRRGGVSRPGGDARLPQSAVLPGRAAERVDLPRVQWSPGVLPRGARGP
ncbi:hypothetical protein THAOC_25047, partial [Thalassiosira oceanica]